MEPSGAEIALYIANNGKEKGCRNAAFFLCAIYSDIKLSNLYMLLLSFDKISQIKNKKLPSRHKKATKQSVFIM